MTTIITYPQTTISTYDVTVFPECFGGGQVYAMVYPTGSRKAVWETLRYGTQEEAIEDARAWVDSHHTVYWTRKGVGCYGTDSDGNPWSTFEAINHGYTCTDCGKPIQRGWAMGKHGDEVYYCSSHISYIENPTPARAGKKKAEQS